MVDLQGRRDAEWTLIAVAHDMLKNSRAVDDGDTVRSEFCHDPMLVLFENSHADGNLVIEQSHAASDHCAVVRKRQQRKSQTRREIVIFSTPIVVPAQT